METDSTLRQIALAATGTFPAEYGFEVLGVEVNASLLSNDERALIQGWAVLRQQEFAAGRLCARQAMETLGLRARPLLRDSDGLPLWPAGVVGSITHCQGIAAAAVRHADGADTLLGLDLEKTNRLSERASRRVLHPLEVSFAGDDQVRATVLFSLKEAFYKAQFPRWRTPGNFQDMALEVDMGTGRALVQALEARFDPGLAALEFRFSLVAEYVLSLCSSP